MRELDLFGKHCRDIVTGFEGICTGMVEWALMWVNCARS